MEDKEFLRRMKERIEASVDTSIELELSDEPRAFSIDFSRVVPLVVMGSDVLEYPGRARMLMQYAILCLRERRAVEEGEFILYLRRN